MTDEQKEVGKTEVNMGAGGQDAVSKTEMPLRMLVLGDFTPDAPEVQDWETSSRLLSVKPSSFQSVMQQLGPRLSLDVPNRLGGKPKELTVELNFTDMKSFRPESIAEQVGELAKLLEVRGLVSRVKAGELSVREFDEQILQIGMDAEWIQRFHRMLSAPQAPAKPEPSVELPLESASKPSEGGGLDSLLDMVDVQDEKADPKRASEPSEVDNLLRAITGQKRTGPRADKSAVETIIDELDVILSQQINEILHHDKFQQLESAWRGLKFVMDRTDFRENIKIEILSVSKDQLRDAIYHQVFTPEYNELVEDPLSVMIADFDFDPTAEDMELLGDIAQICASISVPFVASAGPSFFGCERSSELAALQPLRFHFQDAKYAQWNALRDSEDSQYLALTVPRFLLRIPYGPDGTKVKGFNFAELAKSSAQRLWGRGAFAVATTLVRSFVEDGWCIQITGLRAGGVVENLPVWTYRVARRDVRIPLDASFTQTKGQEFVDSGFVLLTSRINDDKAVVLFAPTIHRPGQFDTPEETAEARLHSTLPYQMFATRMAHYLRRITVEVSTGLTTEQVQTAFVSKLRSIFGKPGVELPPEAVIVEASENQENSDYYDVVMRIRPPLQILGRDVSLFLGIQLHR